MILEVKTCGSCPFANLDSEYGMDDCNLAVALDMDLGLGLDAFEELPRNERHKNCPIDKEIFIKVIIGD